MISILILTKNEEQDLPDCLESVKWSDDIHVFDSLSEDRTVEIALKAGAKVTQRMFDGYASQRNAALTNIQYANAWVLILDADERIPAILVPKLLQCVQHVPDTVHGFRIRRRDFLEGTWLKHAQMSPFYVRLVRPPFAAYHREVNEVLEVKGEILDIDGFFDHFPFSKGYTHWLTKHNHYSSMEALRWVEEQRGEIKFTISKALFSKDFGERRYHRKGLFYKLPARPIIKFIYLVIGRLAFLDGRAGLTYSMLQCIYEYFIVVKTRELINRQKVENK